MFTQSRRRGLRGDGGPLFVYIGEEARRGEARRGAAGVTRISYIVMRRGILLWYCGRDQAIWVSLRGQLHQCVVLLSLCDVSIAPSSVEAGGPAIGNRALGDTAIPRLYNGAPEQYRDCTTVHHSNKGRPQHIRVPVSSSAVGAIVSVQSLYFPAPHCTACAPHVFVARTFSNFPLALCDKRQAQ